MSTSSRSAASRRRHSIRRTDTEDPSRARERALRVLFQADLRGVEPSVTLERLDHDPEARALLDERESLTDETPIIVTAAPSEAELPAGATRIADPGLEPGAHVAGSGRAEAGGDRGTARRPDDQGTRRPRRADGRRDAGAAPETEAASGTSAGVTPASVTAAGGTPGSGPGAGSARASGTGASGWSDEAVRPVADPLDGFMRSLVLGFESERVAVEELIARYARRWAISRMPVVDRNVLRLATYELLHEATPPAVVINEAIALAKRLSTEDSGRFVNGVLESIRRDVVASAAAREAAAEEAATQQAAAEDAATQQAAVEDPATDRVDAEEADPEQADADPTDAAEQADAAEQGDAEQAAVEGVPTAEASGDGGPAQGSPSGADSGALDRVHAEPSREGGPATGSERRSTTADDGSDLASQPGG